MYRVRGDDPRAQEDGHAAPMRVALPDPTQTVLQVTVTEVRTCFTQASDVDASTCPFYPSGKIVCDSALVLLMSVGLFSASHDLKNESYIFCLECESGCYFIPSA